MESEQTLKQHNKANANTTYKQHKQQQLATRKTTKRLQKENLDEIKVKIDPNKRCQASKPKN